MNVRRPRPLVLVLAAASAVIAIIALAVNVRQVAAAFLVAYAAVTSVVLGVLAMMMIALLTTATWFGAVRRRAEIVIGALPALAVLGVLLLPAVLELQPAVAADDRARAIYLSRPFFIARAVLYWIVWLVIAESIRSTSRMQRTGNSEKAARRFRFIACAGLIALAITMTFASFDWMMSLTPRWTSTIYGVYWFAGGAMGALALLAVLDRSNAPPREPTGASQALGKLMLTFVMFWVYIGFAQYIVIWSGNIPVEVTWHVSRTHGAWGFVALALLIGAAIAFVALVNRSLRQRSALVAAFGVLLLVLHYADTYWMVIPDVMPVSLWLLALSAAMLFLVAGATMFVGAVRQSA
jgi:hypothetical protein